MCVCVLVMSVKEKVKGPHYSANMCDFATHGLDAPHSSYQTVIALLLSFQDFPRARQLYSASVTAWV